MHIWLLTLGSLLLGLDSGGRGRFDHCFAADA